MRQYAGDGREGPVLAMLARKCALRVAPLLPSSPSLAATPPAPSRDGEAGSSIEQESGVCATATSTSRCRCGVKVTGAACGSPPYGRILLPPSSGPQIACIGDHIGGPYRRPSAARRGSLGLRADRVYGVLPTSAVATEPSAATRAVRDSIETAARLGTANSRRVEVSAASTR